LGPNPTTRGETNWQHFWSRQWNQWYRRRKKRHWELRKTMIDHRKFEV
jgi:hypothetical protein